MSAVPGAFERLVDDLVMGQACPACCAPVGMRCGEDHRPLHEARRSAALGWLPPFAAASEEGCPMTQGPSTVTDPTDSDDACPGCGATYGVQLQPAPPQVQAWTCRACGLHWAVTVVNPALSIIGVLPTPELRTAALPPP